MNQRRNKLKWFLLGVLCGILLTPIAVIFIEKDCEIETRDEYDECDECPETNCPKEKDCKIECDKNCIYIDPIIPNNGDK